MADKTFQCYPQTAKMLNNGGVAHSFQFLKTKMMSKHVGTIGGIKILSYTMKLCETVIESRIRWGYWFFHTFPGPWLGQIHWNEDDNDANDDDEYDKI